MRVIRIKRKDVPKARELRSVKQSEAGQGVTIPLIKKTYRRVMVENRGPEYTYSN